MKTLRIFISSPGDVGREREISAKVISRVEASFGGQVTLEPYFWEHEPMRSTRGDFQDQIPEPETFDLVVCVLWSRLGSRLHPGKHRREDGTPFASGTEYEFESAIRGFAKRGKPDLLVYRRTEKPSVPLDPPEEIEAKRRQWEALKQFCDKWFREGGDFKAAYNSYEDTADFEQRFEAGLRRLVEDALTREGGEGGGTRPVRKRWWQGSPYRGLHPFEFEHEPVFFGRTQARDKVLGALQARAQNQKPPFVLIFGASGSGKSSLLRAGVMPWLVKPGVIDGVGLWRRAMLKPSSIREGDLLDVLARVLIEEDALPELIADGTPVETLSAMLKDEPKSIVGLIKGALSHAAGLVKEAERLEKMPVTRLALGIDQIEEVFTLADRFDDAGRRAFFRAIRALAESGLVWIVGTLRSDFFHRCEDLPDLIALKSDGGEFHLTGPTPVELSQMIRYPAEAAGVVFEENPIEGKLDEVIANEAMDRPGALPLLEYALDELYAKGADDGLLTHAEYDAVGRVEKAVAKKAEETFLAWAQAAPQDPKQVLDAVLRELVTVGDEEGKELTPVRRVALMSDVARHSGGGMLAQAFVQARLFTADHDEKKEQATLTVAHEALLGTWQRVKDWLQTDREFVLQRRRLDAALLLWRQNGGHNDYLLAPGKPMTDGENLLQNHRQSLDADQVAFVEASQRREKERLARLAKRRRIVMTSLSALTLLSIAACGWALFREQDARDQEQNAKLALAESDTDRAERLFLEGKDALALWYLSRAVASGHGVASTHDRLWYELMHRSWPRPTGLSADMGGSPMAMDFCEHNQLVAAACRDGSIHFFRREGSSGKRVQLDHPKTVRGVRFSPDGTRLLSGCDDAMARVWRLSDQGFVLEGQAEHGDIVAGIDWSLDGVHFATASWDGKVRVWDASDFTAERFAFKLSDRAHTVEFNPNSGTEILAVAGREIGVWNSRDGNQVIRRMSPVELNGASYSPDGNSIATFSPDGEVMILDIRAVRASPATGRLSEVSIFLPGPCQRAQFSPKGTSLMAHSARRIQVHDVGGAFPLRWTRDFDEMVTSAVFLPDGLRLAVSCADGRVFLLAVADGASLSQPIFGDVVPIRLVAGASGTLFVGCSNGRIAGWQFSVPQPLPANAFDLRGRPVLLDTTGVFTAVGSRGRVIQLFDSSLRAETEPRVIDSDFELSSAVELPKGDGVIAGSVEGELIEFFGAGEVRVVHACDGALVHLTCGTSEGAVYGASEKGGLFSWHPENRKVHTLPWKHEGNVTGVGFLKSNGLLMSAGWDKIVHLGDPLQTQNGPSFSWSFDDYATVMAVADEGGKAMLGLSGGGLILINSDGPTYSMSTQTCDGSPTSIVLNPSGTLAAVGTNKGRVMILDTLTDDLLNILDCGDSMINTLGFGGEADSQLAVGCDDGSVWLWDPGCGRSLTSKFKHTASVRAVAFGQGGNLLISVDRSGLMLLWSLFEARKDGSELRRVAAEIVGDGVTPVDPSPRLPTLLDKLHLEASDALIESLREMSNPSAELLELYSR